MKVINYSISVFLFSWLVTITPTSLAEPHKPHTKSPKAVTKASAGKFPKYVEKAVEDGLNACISRLKVEQRKGLDLCSTPRW